MTEEQPFPDVEKVVAGAGLVPATLRGKSVITEDELIREIEKYCAAVGLAPATLCRKAVGNSRLHRSLVDGKGCTLRVAAKLQTFMAENPPSGGEGRMAAE